MGSKYTCQKKNKHTSTKQNNMFDEMSLQNGYEIDCLSTCSSIVKVNMRYVHEQ